jgi:ATP synthase protein I
MGAALATYIIKIVLLLIFVGQFQNTTAFNPKAFGLTALGCILAYTGAQVIWSMKLKMLYVEPDRER